MRPTFHPLSVSKVDRLCEDAVAVTFDVPAELADVYAFRAGQYLTVRQVVDQAEERRSYSICAPPSAAPRIGVRRVEGGLFSTMLVDSLRPGDVLEVLPPLGNFSPALDAGPQHHAFIAAGSGITPVLSIATAVLESDKDSQVTLLYGNRRTDTVMFADELADLKDTYRTRFQLAHVLSREPREADLLSGRLDGERLDALIDGLIDVPSADHWWLCGPHGMVRDAQQVLAKLNVSNERVHQELFFADEPNQAIRREEPTADGPVSEVTITLDGRSTTAGLPRASTILDSAARIRPDLPFACKGGVCGTCRAQVTEGEADMRRNYALEAAEVAAGYVLTCQTYPLSETLSVDYDS